MTDDAWTISGPQVIEIEGARALRVQVVAGRVDVVTHDEAGIRLEVHSVVGRPLEVALDDGELRVGYSYTLSGWKGWLEKFRNFRDKDRVEVHLAVPRTIAAKIATVSADGLVTGIDGEATVSTVSGSLVVDGTSGRLCANTVSGEIVVRDHDGDLTLNSVSGEIAASGHLCAVHANSVSGTLALEVTAGATAVAATTVSGEVTVRLPPEEAVRVVANALSGRLVVDGEEYGGGMPGSRTVDLLRGHEGSTVTVSTVSGDITLLRAARAAAPHAPPATGTA